MLLRGQEPLTEPAQLTLDNYRALFDSNVYWSQLWSSFWHSLVVVAASLVLGFPTNPYFTRNTSATLVKSAPNGAMPMNIIE